MGVDDNATTKSWLWLDGGAETTVITLNNSIIYLNDTSNTFMTLGLTINQGANDNEALALKSSDVAHGMTTYAEADTYGQMLKVSATDGGLRIRGFSESGSAGVDVYGCMNNVQTAKSTSASAAVWINAALIDGTGLKAITADGNLLVVRNYGTTRLIFDAEGDSHQDVGTAWTNFDAEDDIALLTQLSVQVSRPGDPIRENFGEFLHENREYLEKLKLVTFNDDGHHFVNMSRLSMLLVGALRQLGGRVGKLENLLKETT